MLLKFREEINKTFPWLWTLEGIAFKDTLDQVESIDGIKAKFFELYKYYARNYKKI